MIKVVKKRSKVGDTTSILKKNRLKQRVRRGGGIDEDIDEDIDEVNSLFDNAIIEADRVINKSLLNTAVDTSVDIVELEKAKNNISELILLIFNATKKIDNLLLNSDDEGLKDKKKVLKDKNEVLIAKQNELSVLNPSDEGGLKEIIQKIEQGKQEPPSSDIQSCIDKYDDAYIKLCDTYKFLKKVILPSDDFESVFKEGDLKFLKKVEEFIVESNKIIKEVFEIKSPISELLIDFDKFNKETSSPDDTVDYFKVHSHPIISSHINKIIHDEVNNKLNHTTINNIVVNTLNFINIYNMLKLVKKKIIIGKLHIKLLQTQFIYYYSSCIVARVILINHNRGGEEKQNYFYIKFHEHETRFSNSKWIIDKSSSMSMFKSFQEIQTGGGKKSLSVNKIKEIADKLKVSHSKCKSKESIMTKIKSIDLQKLTIEQLKIYCKLFNIKDCSKCKSKKSLLLHTKSNMKVR